MYCAARLRPLNHRSDPLDWLGRTDGSSLVLVVVVVHRRLSSPLDHLMSILTPPAPRPKKSCSGIVPAVLIVKVGVVVRCLFLWPTKS